MRSFTIFFALNAAGVSAKPFVHARAESNTSLLNLANIEAVHCDLHSYDSNGTEQICHPYNANDKDAAGRVVYSKVAVADDVIKVSKDVVKKTDGLIVKSLFSPRSSDDTASLTRRAYDPVACAMGNILACKICRCQGSSNGAVFCEGKDCNVRRTDLEKFYIPVIPNEAFDAFKESFSKAQLERRQYGEVGDLPTCHCTGTLSGHIFCHEPECERTLKEKRKRGIDSDITIISTEAFDGLYKAVRRDEAAKPHRCCKPFGVILMCHDCSAEEEAGFVK